MAGQSVITRIGSDDTVWPASPPNDTSRSAGIQPSAVRWSGGSADVVTTHRWPNRSQATDCYACAAAISQIGDGLALPSVGPLAAHFAAVIDSRLITYVAADVMRAGTRVSSIPNVARLASFRVLRLYSPCSANCRAALHQKHKYERQQRQPSALQRFGME